VQRETRGYARDEVDAFLSRCLASGVDPALHDHLAKLAPAGAPVTPRDVELVKFNKELRGYSQTEVDDLLDQVALALASAPAAAPATSRDLTPAERAVVDRLLGVDFVGADELRQQAGTLRVTGTCGCGCPSIRFAAGPPTGHSHLLVEGWAPQRESCALLFTDAHGRLSHLELEWFSSTPPSGWPHPTALEVSPRRNRL
jgi:DivIVA domain-containing protein